MKATFPEIQALISQAFYEYLDKYPPGEVCIVYEDAVPHVYTEAEMAAYNEEQAWHLARRKELIESGGWTVEEADAAVEADTEAFYEALAKQPWSEPEAGRIIHMDGIEPEPESD